MTLVDFLATHVVPNDSLLATDLQDEEVMSQTKEKQEDTKSNKAWIGIVLPPRQCISLYSFALENGCSNNTAEYEAVFTGSLPYRSHHRSGTLKVVYIVRKVELIPYHERETKLLSHFKKVGIIYVRRSSNAQTDVLAGLTSSLALSKGENLKIVVSERRLLPPFEESQECETIYRVEADPESVEDP